ncbi:MAG: hypothetical protein AABX85_04300 [Nanoarchaeota archaeon]
MGKGYTINGDTIIINRELTTLDLFVKEFIDVLKKYSDYLVVSGFVSISSGRTRGTEDVDILFPITDKKSFSSLFLALKKKGFWCYQGEDAETAYSCIENFSNIRFAKEDEIFPNIELVPINEKRKAKYFEFTHPQKIRIDGFEFKIPPLEFEILYKEIVLAGQKDKADALHLRAFFADIINEKKFKEYEPIIRTELK